VIAAIAAAPIVHDRRRAKLGASSERLDEDI
jgi:hypothetical protein